MTRRKRRSPKRTSAVGDIFHFILAIALIVAAIFVVMFVIRKIRGITGEMINKTEQQTEQAESDIAISNEAESEIGFTSDAEGMTKWRKEDGSYAKAEWIEDSGKFYYFNETERMQTGTKGIEGMLYTFASDGALEHIRYNPGYQPDKNTVLADYPSLVKSKRFWAFLQEDVKLGDFPALMYKRTTDAMAYPLGGEDNPQYASPYSMQIDGDYIYFLAVSQKENLSAEEEAINGKLYRMKPGDTVRQIVAEQVEGYKVLNGKICYESGGQLYETDTAQEDATKNPKLAPTGDEVLYVAVSDGAAYLTDENGEHVSADSGEVKGRGFTYYLNEDGTIRGVKEKKTVNTGGYTYYTESDTAFDEPVSRVMRKSSSGGSEIISAEFPGTVGNLHYDYDTGNMIAEYMDEHGRGRIIQISKSGDVDLIADDTASSGGLVLLAVQDGTAVAMKQSGGADVFITLTIANASPLAVGIDPVRVGDTFSKEESAAISDAPPAVKETGHSKQTEKETPAATVAPTKAAEKTQETPAASGVPDTDAPGSAELVGPEESAVIGGAPPA